MDNNLFEYLARRYMAGEKVTTLAKDAGIPWQRLWGMLHKLPKRDEQQSTSRHVRKQQDEDIQTPRDSVVRDADGIDRITFDSVGQAVIDSLADYAQNERNRSMIADRMVQHLSGYDAWANHYTRQTLLDAIANPPQHLLSAVDDMRKQLMDDVAPPVCTRRRVLRNQEAGDELTPEAVLVRSLNPWERMTRETQPRRSVTIGVNLTVHAGQQAEHLLWRGAAAAALADILTSRGVNVEIVAFWSISRMTSCSRMVVSRYVVKRADMPMDVGAVSVALAEIAYARLVALYGLARHMKGALSKGFGRCEMLPQQDRAGIDYLSESNITSRSGAEHWLRRCVTRQESEVLHV